MGGNLTNLTTATSSGVKYNKEPGQMAMCRCDSQMDTDPFRRPFLLNSKCVRVFASAVYPFVQAPARPMERSVGRLRLMPKS